MRSNTEGVNSTRLQYIDTLIHSPGLSQGLFSSVTGCPCLSLFFTLMQSSKATYVRLLRPTPTSLLRNSRVDDLD
ncbi:hypothetical protein E2C01_071602 [Portunus trituberculatus]|uniref:Uncharacterized protein n=1 Tax=Portunus trituberculatus TaxID=210409 RepID=A0A5B7I4V3_PORTR|nr:hypothetical protein [Portunus trituberculatus]